MNEESEARLVSAGSTEDEGSPAEAREAPQSTSPAVELADAEPEDSDDDAAFDFSAHRRQAIEAYQPVRGLYVDCAGAVRSVLKTTLGLEEVSVLSIEARGKRVDSFADKASSPSEEDPTRPKYSDPLNEITDLSGVRVITYLLDPVKRTNGIVEREFEIIEKVQRTGLLERNERLGYQSFHFLVKFTEDRLGLPEYARFRNIITEIQVRTILQHAWAEIEHDIQYKAVETIPTSIRRRFTSLAGLVEIADREFQAISDEDSRVRQDARRLVRTGALDRVEVTPDALKEYLDRKLGSDRRMSTHSYGLLAGWLKRLGFENLAQVEQCIDGYDDDQISRIIWGSRQGQITRFEDLLLAGMGENFLRLHPFANRDWWITPQSKSLERLKGEIEVGDYQPGAADRES